MTTPAPCPNCAAKLKLADAAFGKPITCPKCGERVTVPAPGGFEEVDDSGFEEVEERPAPARRPTPPRRSEPARPAPRRVARVDEDDDDDEDDYDDRPRRSSRAPAHKGRGPLLAVAAGGGLLLLLVLAGAGAWLAGAFEPSAPAGFVVAKSSGGGYRVFLPGATANPVSYSATGRDGAAVDTGMFGHATHGGLVEAKAESMPQANFNGPLATSGAGTPDELLELFKRANHIMFLEQYTPPQVKEVTLGGQHGLEVRLKERPNWLEEKMDRERDRDDDPAGPRGKGAKRAKLPEPSLGPEFDRQMREGQERLDKAMRDGAAKRDQNAKATVYLFAVRDKRLYTVALTQKGDYPDDATVTTVRESFTFQ